MDCILQHLPSDIGSDVLIDSLASCNEDVLFLTAAAIYHQGIRSQAVIDRLSSKLVLSSKEVPEDAKGDFRNAAALALGKIELGDQSEIDIDALISDLGNGNPQIRAHAAALLGEIGSLECVPEIVTALQDALDDPSLQVGKVALAALGRLGEPGLAVLTDLIRSSHKLCDEVWDVLETAGGPVVAAIIGIYRECEPDMQLHIRMTLGYMEDKPKDTISTVLQVIDSSNIDDFCYILGQYGADAAGAVPLLMEARINDDESIPSVSSALGEIGRDARPAIPYLMKFLAETNDNGTREGIFSDICEIGPSEEEQLELINIFLRKLESDLHWSRHAVVLAEAIRAHLSQNCITQITQALGDHDTRVVERAALLISELGGAGVAFLPALVNAFDVTNKDVCLAILTALGRVGNSDSVLPVLLQALQHDDKDIRREAALATGRIGIKSDEILSLLREGMTGWEKGHSRRYAALAIHKLDPTASEPLRRLKVCPDWDGDEGMPESLFLLTEMGKSALPAVLTAFNDPDIFIALLNFNSDQKTLAKLASPDEVAPTVLTLLKNDDVCLRSRGTYLANMYPVNSEDGPIIEHLWKCLFEEPNDSQFDFCGGVGDLTANIQNLAASALMRSVEQNGNPGTSSSLA